MPVTGTGTAAAQATAHRPTPTDAASNEAIAQNAAVLNPYTLAELLRRARRREVGPFHEIGSGRGRRLGRRPRRC